MDNIFSYIKWRGDLSHIQAPINEVDAIILSAAAYFPFEYVMKSPGESMPLGQAAKKLLEVENIEKKVMFKNDLTLMKALCDSKRFGSMIIKNYVNEIDTKFQYQFSAITVLTEKGPSFVVFRGTDSSLIGWKENFNMTFASPVPSQLKAVKYLEHALKTIRGKFLVCGHSKGGNLAIYASAFVKSRYRKRLSHVYNYDGPGFDTVIIESPGYKSLCPLITTFVPEASVVGMLMEHEEEHTIVKSHENVGILQHEVYTWSVERDRFVYLDKVTRGSRFIDKTLKDWLKKMTYEEREAFVDTIYSIVSDSNAKTLKELADNWFYGARAIIKSAKNLNEDSRALVGRVIKHLAESAKSNLKLGSLPFSKIADRRNSD